MSARTSPGPTTLRRIVELACRAPSIHNTQPWLWRISDTRIDLYGDPTRQLPVADSRGRSLTVSCGAALHHAQVAADAVGLDARVARLPTPGSHDHLATIDLAPGRRSAHATADLRALERRRTDRSRFTSWPMSDERLAALSRAVSRDGVQVVPMTNVSERFRLEFLLRRAIARESSDPRYDEEQRQWIDRSPADGIPSAAVCAGADPRPRMSRFTSHDPMDLDELVQSSDGLLLISTEEDDRAAWLQAGEVLSAAWLRATTDGLSVVPLSQVVEIEETRLALTHELLGGRAAPQALLRIGWQEIGHSTRPLTPRRPVDDVLIT
ncbi:NAD(P)H nitroreductase [Nocardioides endophyticus]|uniref:NAD(P)H nitroreductase n=1 Tax=Nocardioides endophyticus TaxID=1353775 RepID=A0ABP8Z1S3_9ACTN